MNLPLLFSLLTGCLTFSGYVVYNRGIFLGTCKPNVVSWALWAMATILNMASYFAMTGDILKNSLPLVSSVACLVTFIFVLCKKNSARLSLTDMAIFCLGMASVFAWWWFKSATCANMILQFAIFIAFIPTYRSVWKNPMNENPVPWMIFSLAYMMLSVTVILRWHGNNFDLVFPLLGFVLHCALTFLIMLRRKCIA